MKKLPFITLLAFGLASCSTSHKVSHWNSNYKQGPVKCRHLMETQAKEQTEWIFKVKIQEHE